MTEQPLNELEQSIVDNVEEYGCSIISVFDPDGIEPNFSYSIGFPKSLGQPEVVVFSLEKTLRVSMINEIWRQASEEGLRLEEGARVSGLLEDHDCVAREITDAEAIREHFGSAIWFGRRFLGEEPKTAFQIVWPGAHQGLFPWEPGCLAEVIDDQPALYVQERAN